MARSKVVYYGTTLMDITDTTAVASDVAAGKYFYTADGVKTEGTNSGGSTIIVSETTDSHGGTIVEITGEEINLQSKAVTPNSTTQTIESDDGYNGLSVVTVNPIPSEYVIPVGTKTITHNGTEDVSQYASVTVNVQAEEVNLQSKTATPTESQQTISPDSGYDGLSSVTISAIPSTYVGSDITERSSSNLTASGATATQSAGYVASGSKSGTKQLTTQAAKTVTPTKSSQQAVASGVYTTGTVTVAAIPSEYITTTDATATAADINSGETAYVNGVKVTGTQVIQYYYTGTTDPSSSTGSDGDIYLKVVS